MSWQGYTQSSCLVVDCTYVSLHVNCIVWCIKSVPEVDTLYAPVSPARLHSITPGSCCSPHGWFIVSVACISVAMRIDVFVFRPVLASFVLDLICILPLDLMHFARVDPWADKAIHSLVVLWSTTLMWQSMSDAIQKYVTLFKGAILLTLYAQDDAVALICLNLP